MKTILNFRIIFWIWLFCQIACFGSTGSGNLVGGDADSSGASSSPGGDSASFDAGEPIDIPISIAKAEKPIDGRRVSVEYDSLTETTTYRGSANAMTPRKSGMAYDAEGNLLGEFSAREDGSFVLTLTDVPLGSSIALVVKGNEEVSPPIVATMKDSSFYTIAITNQFGISNESLSYFENYGVIFNGQDIDNIFGILYTPVSGGATNFLSDSISQALDQMVTCSAEDFLVGLNSSGHLMRIELSTGAATRLTDEALHPNAIIRLSPNCDYVAATVESGTTAFPILEPTSLVSPSNDRIQINATTTHAYKECSWVGNEILVCLKQTASGTFETELLNIYPYLLVGGNDFEVSPAAIRSFLTEVRNLRVEPTTRAFYTFEKNNSDNDVFELYIDNFTTASSFVDASADYLALANSRWSPDGIYLYFDLTIETAGGDPRTVIGNYNVDNGEKKLVTVGTKAIGVDTDIFVYHCEDSLGENQICVGNLAN